MQTIDSFAFRTLKSEIESHKRLCGEYIIDLVSIEAERSAGRSQEEILDGVFQYFDSKEWPPASERPTDQTWEHDYATDYETATDRVIQTLVGGSNVGHTREAMSAAKASEFWLKFCGFFDDGRKYYVSMGLGHSGYAFLDGVVVVDFARAGILWVTESD